MRTAFGSLIVVLLFTSTCSSNKSSGITNQKDKVFQELMALEGIAQDIEKDLAQGGAELSVLGQELEASLTNEDVSILVRNYLAMMEAYRNNQKFQPDDDFYAVVEKHRDLPFFSKMPARTKSASTGALSTKQSALALNNIKPLCGLPCAAQGTLWGLVDFGVSEIQKYYTNLLASGVDCLQSAGKMGQCASSSTCSYGDWLQFAGDCLALSGEVAISLAPPAKGALALCKTILGLWSAGSLLASTADWISDCYTYQSEHCLNNQCGEDERLCMATNGTGSKCCETKKFCYECTLCSHPCGFDKCCATGQRCEDGQCVTCASACGSSCCLEKEVCANPDMGLCAPCDNPCGMTCCPDGTTCLKGTYQCCANPCGLLCCGEDEECVGMPPVCCENPCGDQCCGKGQACNEATNTCETPSDCDDTTPLNCNQLCQIALAQIQAECASMGGTIENPDISICLSACQCLMAKVPNISACLKNPSCPQCADLEEVSEECGGEYICKITEDE